MALVWLPAGVVASARVRFGPGLAMRAMGGGPTALPAWGAWWWLARRG